MVIFVDIDKTICNPPYNKTGSKDYKQSTPIKENIDKINTLYKQGHTIVYWTARGSVSGDSHFKLTLNQLKKWNAKFHELRMGKPYYDLFIDDKSVSIDFV